MILISHSFSLSFLRIFTCIYISLIYKKILNLFMLQNYNMLEKMHQIFTSFYAIVSSFYSFSVCKYIYRQIAHIVRTIFARTKYDKIRLRKNETVT